MNTEMQQAMEIVSVRILEDAAFLFVEPNGDLDTRDDEWVPEGAQLRWSGPTRGSMRVWMDSSLLALLTANMLGIEEDDPAAVKAGPDALREILNMVVGNCLTEAWGPDPVFRLELPEDADPSLFALDSIEGLWMAADDHPVLFWCGDSR